MEIGYFALILSKLISAAIFRAKGKFSLKLSVLLSFQRETECKPISVNASFQSYWHQQIERLENKIKDFLSRRLSLCISIYLFHQNQSMEDTSKKLPKPPARFSRDAALFILIQNLGTVKKKIYQADHFLCLLHLVQKTLPN